MTIETMLTQLRQERDALSTTIEMLERRTEAPQVVRMARKPREVREVAADSTRNHHHLGLHWTQRPENKARLRRMLKRAVATKRLKHAAA